MSPVKAWAKPAQLLVCGSQTSLLKAGNRVWMVAWALRHLGRTEEALAVQRGLRAELDAAGLDDPYVDEELALLEP